MHTSNGAVRLGGIPLRQVWPLLYKIGFYLSNLSQTKVPHFCLIVHDSLRSLYAGSATKIAILLSLFERDHLNVVIDLNVVISILYSSKPCQEVLMRMCQFSQIPFWTDLVHGIARSL